MRGSAVVTNWSRSSPASEASPSLIRGANRRSLHNRSPHRTGLSLEGEEIDTAQCMIYSSGETGFSCQT